VNLELDVQYADEVARRCTPSPQQVEDWVRVALSGQRSDAQLVVRIVGEKESAGLNSTYRGRTGATNVLSFCFEEPELLTPPLLGDVVICAPLVEAEAREQGKEPHAHWAHLVIHGVLHLLAYDHVDDGDAEVMECRERELLALLGFPDPYTEATTGMVDRNGGNRHDRIAAGQNSRQFETSTDR
jgi:probable rRNA maturation factor